MSLDTNSQGIFSHEFELEAALEKTRELGYMFALGAIRTQICELLAEEVDAAGLEVGDHVENPINVGKANEVSQRHARLYVGVGSDKAPIASRVSQSLTSLISSEHSELANWAPTEIGYQRYRSTDDWISPHRDRRNDRLLAVTITIGGSALIRVFDTIDNPDDYRRENLCIIDEFQTEMGSVMMLRAPGFGSGEQVIHEVLPPDYGQRVILNLRMRPDVLKAPNQD